MSRSGVYALVMCGLASICLLPISNAQALSSPYESTAVATSNSRSGWDALGGLYRLLAQHDALDGHALARKSVRSPSRRLRFGRRSDPDMPPQTPVDELDELLSLRDVRTPVRLRFGRRSDELAVPHIFPQELNELEMSPRELRTPLRLRFGRRSEEPQKMDEAEEIMSLRNIRTPLRLRFGRRSEESAAPQDQKIDEAEEVMSLRDIRTPLRLRFGRSEERAVPHSFPLEDQDRAVRAPSMRLRFGRRSDNTILLPYESAPPKEEKASTSVEDDRQQE